MNQSFRTIGIIGAGSFGTAISNIAAEKAEKVLVFARSAKRLHNFNIKKENNGYRIADNIEAIDDIEQITTACTLLIGLVPSKNFRSMVKSFSPFLKPDHIIIHGTKGVDIELPDNVSSLNHLNEISRSQIFTMSEVIHTETSVRRIGCLAGPNLSGEILKNQPAGAMIASRFDEVIQAGKDALSIERFKVFSSHDIIGAEFAGVLKNIYAISSGILDGLGYGTNARALLITKGLHEMLYLGKSLGAETSAFLGISGIGDLVATCSSPLSRNFTVGMRIAKGESLSKIIETMDEVAEGIRSVQIFHAYCLKNKLKAPFTEMLYKVMFKDKNPIEAVKELMAFRYSMDVSFL